MASRDKMGCWYREQTVRYLKEGINES